MQIQFDPGSIRHDALVLPLPKAPLRLRANETLRSVAGVERLPIGLAKTSNSETLVWLILACSAAATLVLSFSL